MSDDALDEMEARARRALKVDEFKPGALSAEEQLVARQLMGTGNAERVARARPGQRVRLMPTVTWYEFYILPGDSISPPIWKLDRIVNNRKEDSQPFYSNEAIAEQVAALRKKGFTVREITMGAQPRLKDMKRASGRKELLQRLRGFKA